MWCFTPLELSKLAGSREATSQSQDTRFLTHALGGSWQCERGSRRSPVALRATSEAGIQR